DLRQLRFCDRDPGRLDPHAEPRQGRGARGCRRRDHPAGHPAPDREAPADRQGARAVPRRLGEDRAVDRVSALAKGVKPALPAADPARWPRVAVIGCGYWGKNLVRNFAELGVLAALIDSHEERTAQLSAKHGGAVRGFEEVLADEDIGAVV